MSSHFIPLSSGKCGLCKSIYTIIIHLSFETMIFVSRQNRFSEAFLMDTKNNVWNVNKKSVTNIFSEQSHRTMKDSIICHDYFIKYTCILSYVWHKLVTILECYQCYVTYNHCCTPGFRVRFRATIRHVFSHVNAAYFINLLIVLVYDACFEGFLIRRLI